MINGTFPVGIKPKGFATLTVSTSAVPLVVPKGSVRAVITVEAEALRWRDDSTDPTATVGFLELAGSRFEIYGKEALLAFRAIRDGATDSVLTMSFYG